MNKECSFASHPHFWQNLHSAVALTATSGSTETHETAFRTLFSDAPKAKAALNAGELHCSAKEMNEGRPIFRNQRLVARVAVGMIALFFGFMAWQGIHYDEFWGKFGAVIKREDRPEKYWSLFFVFSAVSATAAFICITWKKRGISRYFPDK